MGIRLPPPAPADTERLSRRKAVFVSAPFGHHGTHLGHPAGNIRSIRLPDHFALLARLYAGITQSAILAPPGASAATFGALMSQESPAKHDNVVESL